MGIITKLINQIRAKRQIEKTEPEKGIDQVRQDFHNQARLDYALELERKNFLYGA